MKESLATKRARERDYFQNPQWFCDFDISPLKGCFEPEEGVHRRDPSSVIKHGDDFYVYYTKSVGPHVGFGNPDLSKKVFPWDYSEIWVATSKDGYTWSEKNLVIKTGDKGAYDERSVFTPEILVHENKFYVVYQTVENPYVNRVFENISIAVSDSPLGPFKKSDKPILTPTKDGIWEGDEDNRFLVKKKGSFDSHKVHDPLLFFFNNKFYLYYKGEPMGEEIFMGGRETKWGLAIAENPFGPYERCEYNPITNSGHETCLWKYKNGFAAFLRTDGVEKNTLQFAQDGINFEIKSVIKFGPEASGPFRGTEDFDDPLQGMKWGLSHNVESEWGYIVRFDLNTNQRDIYMSKEVKKADGAKLH